MKILSTLIAIYSMLALPTLALADKIDVTFKNYNQAETARNFDNWAKRGGDNKLLHEKKLSPVGPDAPTIRMNLDTLYSVGVYDNDGEMSVTIPKSDVYQSIMILDTDGYTPFFLSESLSEKFMFLNIAFSTSSELTPGGGKLGRFWSGSQNPLRDGGIFRAMQKFFPRPIFWG